MINVLRSLLGIAATLYILPVSAIDKGEGEVDPRALEHIGRFGDDSRVSSEGYQFSEAETLIWLGDQLANIDRPRNLKYEVVRAGSSEDGFRDTVELDILEVNPDGSKNVQLTFLSGERDRYVPPRQNTNVNPIVGVYLQGDVQEMNRLTGGHWRYFQKWIKLAIAEDAKIEPVTFDFQGSKVKGKKISFSPYLRDPGRVRYKKHSEKAYEITMSSEVPGTLYRIRSVIPDNRSPGNGPLIEETLTFIAARDQQ